MCIQALLSSLLHRCPFGAAWPGKQVPHQPLFLVLCSSDASLVFINSHTCTALTSKGSFSCCAFRKGDIFDRQKHESGTEVKAITYSAMQINETKDDAELFVIVDI